MKTCKKCTQDKPIDSFTVDVRYKDGRYPWCFECRKAWRDARKDKQKELHANWREQNRDHVREYSLAQYYQNRDDNLARRRVRQRERWQNDPAYRARKNAEKKARYYTHPEFNKKRKAWSVVTSHRRRMRVRGTASHFSQAEWRALCTKYNHCCLCCGQQKPLSPDHVVPIARGGLNGIDNIQPLCRQCNQAKGTKTIDYRPTGSD